MRGCVGLPGLPLPPGGVPAGVQPTLTIPVTRSVTHHSSELLSRTQSLSESETGAYRPVMAYTEYQEGGEVRKDDKYWERRRKNNMAAKKSRDSRRIRENQMRLRERLIMKTSVRTIIIEFLGWI